MSFNAMIIRSLVRRGGLYMDRRTHMVRLSRPVDNQTLQEIRRYRPWIEEYLLSSVRG